MRTLLEQVAQPQSDDTIIFIYGLADPRTTLVRYVGKSIYPKLRYNHHMQPAQLRKKSRKNAWLNELVSIGIKPDLIILGTAIGLKWIEEEVKWISHFRELPGYPRLTNIADGGQGHHGVMTPEEIRKRSQARVGIPMPPGTGAKISASNKGKAKTPESRANFSAGQKNRWVNASLEDRKKMQNFPLPELTEDIKKRIAVGLRNVPRRKGCSSIYRGVTKVKRNKPWLAGCSVDNKHKHLGSFATEEEAGRARDRFILESFPGCNIELNFPRSDYE